MTINVKNISSGQIVSIDTDYVVTVEIQTSTTLKVTLKNKMTYIVEYHEELLKKAPVQLNLFGKDLDKGIDRGEQKKLRGIKRAVDHANIKNAGTWLEQAYQSAKLFLASKKVGYTFMVEDIRVWTEVNNLVPQPPDRRAWGGMVSRLVKEGFIARVGFGTVKNEIAHKAVATVWIKK